MLVKKSIKNQIVIPKAVLERAGLAATDVYFDIEYEAGRIILKPMQVEEKIPVEVLDQFEARTLKREPGDKTYASTPELIKDLPRKKR